MSQYCPRSSLFNNVTSTLWQHERTTWPILRSFFLEKWKWTDQHNTSVGQRRRLSARQESPAWDKEEGRVPDRNHERGTKKKADSPTGITSVGQRRRLSPRQEWDPWTQFLSRTHIFCLSHAGVMLISSLFTFHYRASNFTIFHHLVFSFEFSRQDGCTWCDVISQRDTYWFTHFIYSYPNLHRFIFLVMEQSCFDLILGAVVLKAMLHKKVTFLQQKVSPAKNVITFYPNSHNNKMLLKLLWTKEVWTSFSAHQHWSNVLIELIFHALSGFLSLLL